MTIEVPVTDEIIKIIDSFDEMDKDDLVMNNVFNVIVVNALIRQFGISKKDFMNIAEAVGKELDYAKTRREWRNLA